MYFTLNREFQVSRRFSAQIKWTRVLYSHSVITNFLPDHTDYPSHLYQIISFIESPLGHGACDRNCRKSPALVHLSYCILYILHYQCVFISFAYVGLSKTGGLWYQVADFICNLFRMLGIGSVSNCVDDFMFLWTPSSQPYPTASLLNFTNKLYLFLKKISY